MVRKLAAVFLLSFLITAFLATAVCLGAEKPMKRGKARVTLPARYAPAYSAIGKSDALYSPSDSRQAERIPLRSTKSYVSNPTEFGETSYDYQHNCTMARQVEHRAGYLNTPYGGYIHSNWMALQDNDESEASPRGVGYQAIDIAGNCATLFGPDQRMNNARAGYCGIDAHNPNPDYPDTGWAVGYAHEDPEFYAGYAYWDSYVLGPAYGLFFSDFPLDHFGYYFNNGTGPDNEMIWPKGSWDIDGAEYVFHMVCSEASPPGTEAGAPQTCSYYRRTGPYGAGEGAWSNQRVIDTVMVIGATVASSPISDKVAVVWVAPADYVRDTDPETEFGSQYDNDVWFAIATDNGLAWATNPTSGGAPSIGNTVDLGVGADPGYNRFVGGNLTKYDSVGLFRAYCDMSVLWSIKDDPDDWLQITWGCRQWTGRDTLFRRNGAIFHWNQKTDSIRQVARANWDTGGTCVGHAWGTDVAKHTISECDGRFYVTFTQFGFDDEPCGVYDTTVGQNGHVIAGQLYTAVYDEVYGAWDRPQITVKTDDTLPHSSAPGNVECIPDEYDWDTGTLETDGDCSSEYWSSMARYGRVDTCLGPAKPVIDIMYINDQAPGGCVQTESGVWVLNPVNWYVDSCRQAVPEPGFEVTPTQFGICYDEPIIVVDTVDVETVTMTLGNPGILANVPVSVTPTYVSGGLGGGATTVTAAPNAGITIPPAGGQVPVTLTITTNNEQDFVTVFYDIVIVHQAGPTPPTTVIVPMCITVANNYIPLENAIIRTDCKRLRIYNNSEMSNNAANASLDFMPPLGPNGDPDDCATIYLYDGSKIICREPVLPGDDSIMCWFSIFGQYYGSERAIVQASPLFVDSVSNPDYTYATFESMTADSSIGLIVEYFAPKAPADCSYMLIKQKIFNRTEVTLTGVAWGDALDWDIPGYEANGDGVINDNFPGQDAGRYLLWLTNVGDTPPQTDPCDTLAATNRYGGIAAAQNTGAPQDGAGFKNYLALENDQWVYESGDESQPGNPYPPSLMYTLMTTTDGYYYSQDPPADTGEDLNAVVTIGVVDLVPGDTICAVKIVTTSKDDPGAGILKNNVDLANAFVDGHDEIKCSTGPGPCDCLPGDPNNDQTFNVGDAVYIINYVFKGGPAPIPYATCSGDPNADCSVNVGDGVYLINYVFKGGPAPKTCEEWVANCGPTIY
jgi:hypothetical protein